MNDRIDISEHVSALCKTLGLEDKNAVGQIVIDPNKCTVLVYKRNENGKFFVTGDMVGTETHVFPVTT